MTIIHSYLLRNTETPGPTDKLCTDMAISLPLSRSFKSSGIQLSHSRSLSQNNKSRAKVVNFRYSFVFHTISPHL